MKKEKFIEKNISKRTLMNKSKIPKKNRSKTDNILESEKVQLIKKITEKMKIVNNIDKILPPISVSNLNKLKKPSQVIIFVHRFSSIRLKIWMIIEKNTSMNLWIRLNF